MIISMTGYGRSEVSKDGLTVSVELRSLNSRYLEVITRVPRELSPRENDIREILRKTLTRGKVHVNINIEREQMTATSFTVDPELVKSYKDALDLVRKAAKIKEVVNLGHLMTFGQDLLKINGGKDEDLDWDLIAGVVDEAVKELERMRRNEGRELAHDIRERIKAIDEMVDKAEKISKEKVPQERQRLRERIAQLFENDEIDEQRLEFEIVILAEKLDVTEECVRYRSHSKYFVEAVKGPDPAGRKLGFLLQEINREITTIGSKSNDAEIAHLVVQAKEELEKIREQVQNIE